MAYFFILLLTKMFYLYSNKNINHIIMDTTKTLSVLTIIDGTKTVVEVRNIGSSLWQIMSGEYRFYVLRSDEIIECIQKKDSY